MGLRIAPFPAVISIINPDWIILVIIYWTLRLPYQNGVFTAWIIGLLTDVLTGRTLGEYALIYSLLSYLSIIGHKRLRQYPLLQQSSYIFICLFIEQLWIFFIESLQSITQFSLLYWLPILTGTLMWCIAQKLLLFIRTLGR